MYKLFTKKIALLGLCALLLLSGCNNSAKGTSEHPGSRLDEIIHRGYIEVATEPYFAPNEFIDPSKPDNEKYVGSDIELARYIAKDLGVELRVVPLEFSAVLAGISDGKYDLAISALAYTPQRAETLNLSKGYYFSENNVGHGLLIRTDDKDIITGADALADKTVVVQSGSLQELFVSEQVPAYGELKKVSSTMDGFLMVEENKADTSVTSISMAKLYIEANPNAGLMIVEDFQFVQDKETDSTRVAMPKGEDELTERINKIIDELLASGQYEQWYAEYTEYAANIGL